MKTLWVWGFWTVVACGVALMLTWLSVLLAAVS